MAAPSLRTNIAESIYVTRLLDDIEKPVTVDRSTLQHEMCDFDALDSSIRRLACTNITSIKKDVEIAHKRCEELAARFKRKPIFIIHSTRTHIAECVYRKYLMEDIESALAKGIRWQSRELREELTGFNFSLHRLERANIACLKEYITQLSKGTRKVQRQCAAVYENVITEKGQVEPLKTPKGVQTKEPVAKLPGTEKSMILRRFESGSQAATTHPTRGSIEEEGLKGPKKGDFNGQMSFATASKYSQTRATCVAAEKRVNDHCDEPFEQSFIASLRLKKTLSWINVYFGGISFEF